MVLASKETMGAALGSASSALAPATSSTTAAVAVSSLVAAVVEASAIPQASHDPSRPVLDIALKEEEPEVHIDEAVTSALEGISLVISMDNPLDFSAISPVSHELKTRGSLLKFLQHQVLSIKGSFTQVMLLWQLFL